MGEVDDLDEEGAGAALSEVCNGVATGYFDAGFGVDLDCGEYVGCEGGFEELDGLFVVGGGDGFVDLLTGLWREGLSDEGEGVFETSDLLG